MAGYAFGSVIALDAFITMISFIGVIVFILFFDMMIELMEYFLEGTKLYHNMIQMIYKELMLMGLVSFTIVMITATQKTQHITNPTVTEWITSVDYSHILLFFLTFFFVIHAFYLMRKAILCGTDYRKSAKMKLSDLIQEMKKLQDRKVDSMLFQLQYIPFSQIRDHIEFYLLQSLFRDTYWLPEDFHFSEYLSNCFNRHALKTVNRTWITWVTLIIFAVLNYGRVQLHIGFGSCHAEVAAAHGNSTITDDHLVATDDHHVATDDHGTAVTHSVVAQLMQSVMTSGNRYLEASSSSSSSHADDDLSNTCRYNYVKLFLSSAVVLCGYTFLIVFISRLYKIRMLHRIGLQSPEDYLDFLEFSQAEDERKKRMKALEKKLGKPIGNKNKDPVRITNALLKQDIERVLDADEHGHHEEAEFRVIAEFLAHIFNTTKEYAQMLILKIRISLNRGVSALGSASGDEDDDVNIGAASGKSGDNGSVSDSETRSGELVGGSPNRRSALKKTKSILRRESVTEVVDSREKSFYHHQHEKKEFMDKLVSTQPNKRKWSVVKNNATAPDPASNSNTAGSTSNQSIDRQSLSSPPHHDLAIIKEDSNGRGSNSGHSAGSDKETKPSHEPHHGPPPVQAKVPNERSRRRSVIDLIHHMDLPDLDQERNMTFTAAHNVQHHGIGNSLRVAAQHANTKETSIRGAAGVGGDGHSIADNHGTHAHPPAHQNSVPAPTISIRRAPSQDEEPHSAKHHVKNSVVVHAPEHGYSTVEKFLKKQNEEHHLMMLQMEQHGGHHSGSSGILGTMRHVGDALSVRGGGGGGGNGAASMRKAHVNPVSTRMKAVSIRRVQKPAQTDVETGKEAEAEAEDEEEVRLTADFSDIYLFGNVVYFHRAVELCILFNCLYMAFWTTDFIAITSHIEQSVLWRWLDQLAM